MRQPEVVQHLPHAVAPSVELELELQRDYTLLAVLVGQSCSPEDRIYQLEQVERTGFLGTFAEDSQKYYHLLGRQISSPANSSRHGNKYSYQTQN